MGCGRQATSRTEKRWAASPVCDIMRRLSLPATDAMTPAEHALLSQPRLSHPARTLYWLLLRPACLRQTDYQVSYPELGRALAVEDTAAPGGFAYQVTARQLTELFDELIQAGLVALPPTWQAEHYHLCPIQLPLLPRASALPLPQAAFAMHADWHPDTQFTNLARLCGLLDSQYGEEELGEFIAYWLGRPEQFANQHQWQLKFIKALKARRYPRRPPHEGQREIQGYQQVTVDERQGPSTRALEMMAQARQLQDKGTPDE